MANIAEGFGRGTQAEFVTFLGYSLGSLNETQSHLCAAYDRAVCRPGCPRYWERNIPFHYWIPPKPLLVEFPAGVKLGRLETTNHRQRKGDGAHLCEAPSGPFRQMSPVPCSS